MFVANFAQFFFDDGEDALLFRENVAQVLDRVDQLLVFIVDLFPLETGELVKAKIENLIRLMFAKSVATLDQARLAIDAMKALVPVLEGALPEEMITDLNQATANMQLAYAKAAGEQAREKSD
jgi:hypothetical protein